MCLLLLSHELELAQTDKQGTLHRFEGAKNGLDSKVRNEDGYVWINATQHFTAGSTEVWEYEIGEYQMYE